MTIPSFKLPKVLERAVDEIDRQLASGLQEMNLDFEKVTFVTVDGLEWLEELLLHSQSKRARVRFINCCPEIYKVFKVAHINSLLEVSGGAVVSGPVC